MAQTKTADRFDSAGARRVMRKRDYFADFSGQMALGLMANLVGQLSYFYTDKVGIALEKLFPNGISGQNSASRFGERSQYRRDKSGTKTVGKP